MLTVTGSHVKQLKKQAVVVFHLLNYCKIVRSAGTVAQLKQIAVAQSSQVQKYAIGNKASTFLDKYSLEIMETVTFNTIFAQ